MSRQYSAPQEQSRKAYAASADGGWPLHVGTSPCDAGCISACDALPFGARRPGRRVRTHASTAGPAGKPEHDDAGGLISCLTGGLVVVGVWRLIGFGMDGRRTTAASSSERKGTPVLEKKKKKERERRTTGRAWDRLHLSPCRVDTRFALFGSRRGSGNQEMRKLQGTAPPP